MIRINLFPYYDKRKEANVKRQAIIIIGSLVLFVLTLASLFFYVTSTIASLEKETRILSERSAILAKQVGDIETFKRDKEELKKKLSVINILEENRFFALKLLHELSRLVPSGDVWLDRTSQNNNELLLEGFARDNLAVARLMKSIEKSNFFKSVEIIVSKRAEIEKVPVQQFVLRGIIKKERDAALEKKN